jgi:HAD superfamily hydrolase (TIGR01509 family)
VTIQLVAFDLGGVLFTDGMKVLVEQLPPGDREAVRALLKSEPSRELRRGRIDDATFWSWAASQLPAHLDPLAIRDAWYAAYTPVPEMFALAERLRPHVRLAAFSGNIRSRIEQLDARTPFRHLFDLEVYSFDHGTTKPEPDFVDAFLRLAAVPPSAILYLDDKESALAPARARGVHCLLVPPNRQNGDGFISGALRRVGLAVDAEPTRAAPSSPSARPTSGTQT